MYQLQSILMVLFVAQYTVTYSMPIQKSSKRDVTDSDDINNLRESITALETIQLVLVSTVHIAYNNRLKLCASKIQFILTNTLILIFLLFSNPQFQHQTYKMSSVNYLNFTRYKTIFKA